MFYRSDEEKKRRRRTNFTAIALLCMSILGCASPTHQQTDDERQRQALISWNRCIDRNATELNNNLLVSAEQLEQACEGHKRDVLMAYPERLESRLDAMLVQRTRKKAIEHVTVQTLNRSTEDQSDAILETFDH
ncbi:MAG: hypothetical protein KTR35_01975 [Gammaproteobacteria bacterium]|nr:hypothetical protein [Gammaproteobacteria bacterium]